MTKLEKLKYVRGPHEARGFVGRAKAQVALMLTRSTVNAILLLNAILEIFLQQKDDFITTFAPSFEPARSLKGGV